MYATKRNFTLSGEGKEDFLFKSKQTSEDMTLQLKSVKKKKIFCLLK